MSSPQVWLITGSASGLGRAVAEIVLGHGDIAVATDLKPEGLSDLATRYSSDKLLILTLDVTKSEDIIQAFSKVKNTFGKLDVVYNNAGYGVVGEIEGIPDDLARAQFEPNFWGAVAISKEAVRFFREVNGPSIGGRLLNVTSAAGLHGRPGLGYYSASKHALEGFSESLAAELDPEWNIKLTIIEPGEIRTRVRQNAIKTPVHPAYTKPTLGSHQYRAWVEQGLPIAADPAKVAQRFYELAHLPDPPLRFPIGKDCVQGVKERIEHLSGMLEKYESWSDDLAFDS